MASGVPGEVESGCWPPCMSKRSAAVVGSTNGTAIGTCDGHEDMHALRQQSAVCASDSDLVGKLRNLTLHPPGQALAAQT